MKPLLKFMASVAIGVIVCNAQSTSIYKPYGQPSFYPNGGKFEIRVEPSEPVVSFDQLIRMSELIIDGTVSEVLPSIKRDPDHPGPDHPAIETHSLVSVQQILRGALSTGTETVALVQEGGHSAKWDVTFPDDPLVKPGERYILFLVSDTRKEPANNLGVPRYMAVGIWSGRVKVNTNGTVQALPAAAPALHFLDGSDVSFFIATINNRIGVLFPPPLPYPHGAKLLKPPPNSLFPPP